MPRVIQSPYWYRTWIDACPVCGHEDIYRERVYGLKPSNPKETHIYRDYYDNCMERFQWLEK